MASNPVTADISKEENDRQIINDVILGLHTLPADATPWDLLKAQVQADFAPFLIIIPKPVKRFIAAKAVILFDQFRRTFEGPATPMIRAGGKIIGVLGSLLEYVGKDIQKLSKVMVMFGDNQNKSDQGDDRTKDESSSSSSGSSGSSSGISTNSDGTSRLSAQMAQTNGRQAQSKATEDQLAQDQYELEEDLIDYVIDIDENGGESEIKGYKSRGSSAGGSKGSQPGYDKIPSPAQAQDEDEEEDVVFYQPEDAYEGEGELIEI